MKALTNQQKILAGLVALGGAALFVDRLVVGYDLTGPSQASASVASALAGASATPSASGVATGGVVTTGTIDATVTTATEVTAAHALSDRLATIGASQSFALADLADGFRPSPRWISPQAQTAKQQVEATMSPVERARQFAEAHKLEAIIASNGGSPLAMVDGQPVAVGGKIGDFVLVRVDPRSAHFECQGQAVVLKLSVVESAR